MNEFEPIVTGFRVLRSQESAADAPVKAPAPIAAMKARIATKSAITSARRVERFALRLRARSRRGFAPRGRTPLFAPLPLPFRVRRPFGPRPFGPRAPLPRAGGI
jgi:hypothetical protein